MKAAHSWTREDWQGAYDERAAIREHDAGLPRSRAESMAAHDLVNIVMESFGISRSEAVEYLKRQEIRKAA